MPFAKIAVSLPRELLEAVDAECHERGATRSEFFRRAVAMVLRAKQLHEEEERYEAGYRALPETEEDNYLESLGLDILRQEPWE